MVGLLGEGVHRGRDYLVLEYVPGGDLRRFLQHPRPRAELLRLFQGVSRGLAELHALGLVHRDIKPENVLIGSDGEARLSDLGLVRALDSQTHLTTEGVLVGTMCYLAPEQIVSGELSAAADLYALGACLYEALAGAPLFEGRTEFEIMQHHVRDEPVPPARRVGDLDDRLNDLVLRLVSKDPGLRPSAEEVARTLRECLAGPAAAESDEAAPRAGSGATGSFEAQTPAPASAPDPPHPGRRSLVAPLLALFVAVSLLVGYAATGRYKQLSLDSEPHGAAVSLDGRPVGQTPLRLNGLALGRQRLRLEKAGYLPHSEWVELAVGQLHPARTITLRPLARLPLVLNPADTQVLVNGRSASMTDGVLELAPGSYRLELRRADHLPQTRQVSLMAGNNPALAVVLKSKQVAHLKVLAPPGARVLLDGQPMGSKTVRPGKHELLVRKNGHRDHRQSLQLEPGAEIEVRVALEPAAPSLKVTARPAARVYLNGVERGRTPLSLAGLPPGACELKLTAPGYLTARKKLSLHPGTSHNLAFHLEPLPPPPAYRPPRGPAWYPPPPAPRVPPDD
ncbi:PEGA domain-containing protein [bacterium CPR1]|nr:PEGA domain-containing protein [bacterium CPR1]